MCADFPEVPHVLCHRDTKCSTVREIRTRIPKKSSEYRQSYNILVIIG